MSLVLHLFKKDLRRSQLLLALWLLLVVLQYTGLGLSLHPGDHQAFLINRAASTVLPTLRSIVVAVLVAFLLQEEPLAGTTAFWLSRPISRSAVLRTKTIFALIMLTVPLIAEILVLVASGTTPGDIALAIPEVVMSELQILLSVAVVAAVTPNFGRFAIVAAVIGVGMYLISAGLDLLPREMNYRGPGVGDATRFKSSQIAGEILIISGLGAAIIYQYLTRQTARTVATAVIVVTGYTLIPRFWRWDFFPSLPAPVSTVSLDSDKIHLALQETQAIDLSNYRNTDLPKKNINGMLQISGIPSGYVALPTQVRPRITLSDGQVIRTREPAPSNYEYAPFWSALFKPTLGQTFVYGRTWTSMTTPCGLALLDASDFRKYSQEKTTYSADIDFDVARLVVVSRLPLVKGSHDRHASEHKFITDILREGDGISVLVQTRSLRLLFARPSREEEVNRYLYSGGYIADRAYYVLLNRRNHEAILPKMGSGNWVSAGGDARLVEQTWQISFGPENYTLIPNLNDAWLADAELVELRYERAATLAQKLEVSGFTLQGPNKTRTAEPAYPPVDPDWYTRFVLPENATKTQIKAYVDDVIIASQYSHDNSWSEIPVAMLSKIGAGNMDILLSAMDRRGQYREAEIARLAVLRTAGQEDKATILQALEKNPRFVDLVIKYKWEADCRDTLISALKDPKKTDLPRNWIAAVVSLNDPATYPDLKSYLVRAENRRATYNVIHKLPNIDLASTVQAAWIRARTESNFAIVDAAEMAIDVGYPDALAVVVDVLRANDVSRPKQVEDALMILKRYVPVEGDARAIVTWYDANKSHLIFDQRKKKYLPTQTVVPSVQ